MSNGSNAPAAAAPPPPVNDRSGPPMGIQVVVSIAAMLAGAGMMLWPLLSGGASWTWSPTSMDALSGAKINAMLMSVGLDGVRLARQGSRPVSLISPPLSLNDDVGAVVEVEAAVPVPQESDSPDGAKPSGPNQPPVSKKSATVVLLWQTSDVPEYKYEVAEATLGLDPAVVRFSVPVPPSQLYRLGVQFPDVDGDVLIRRIAFPELPLSERMRLAAREFAAREPFAAHSINMLRGPSILGASLNTPLFGLILFAVGIAGVAGAFRRRRIRGTVVVAIVVAVWVIEDARATVNLARNAREETAYFTSETDENNRVAATHGGYEIAWAYELLRDHAEPGARFCVISDDNPVPSHRLAYLLAPKLINVEDCATAIYIVVIKSSAAEFDADASKLVIGGETVISATPVAQLADHVYILRRTGA